MKQLCEVLNNISPTAEKQTQSLAVPKYSLTKEDGKMITAVANALIVRQTIDKESLCQSLKSLMNLAESPSMTSRTVFRSEGYGADFEPDEIKFGELTEEQREKGLEFVRMMSRPMTVDAINKLYTKLRLSTKHAKDTDANDEKLRMAIYVDELRKHPANVVRTVLNIPYEFFPSLNEIICDCEREEKLLKCIERSLK